MVIDFSRLNNSPSVTGGLRTGTSQESAASNRAGQSDAAAVTAQSGELSLIHI